MDKQKINIEQLYQERFQSFELETAPDVNITMKGKIKYFKNLQLIKWAAIGVGVTATVVTIATIVFLSFMQNPKSAGTPSTEKTQTTIQSAILADTTQIADNKPDTQSQVTNPQSENQSQVSVEKNISSPQTNKTNYEKTNPQPTQEMALEQEEIISVDKEIVLPVNESIEEVQVVEQEKILELPDKESLEISQDSAISIIAPSIPVVSEQADKAPDSVEITKPAKTTNESPTKPTPESWHLQGYLDGHFAPVIWNNYATPANPDLDTSWTYSLNSSPQLSYEFGLAFQLHHEKWPLFFQFGLDYQILKEKVDFRLSQTYEDPNLSFWDYDSIFEIHEIIDTFYIIVDSNHFVVDTIFTFDTVLSQIDSAYNARYSTAEKRKQHVNTYTYLQIPLMLGYEFSTANNRWNFLVMAGAALSINLTNKGWYYTKDGDFESYSGKISPSLIWNFSAAANINYRWKKWQIFAQPEYQYQLNESELTDQLPRRKYGFYKVKVGISYRLF